MGEVGGTYKASDKVSDHQWSDQGNDKHTGFTEELTVLGDIEIFEMFAFHGGPET